MAQIMQTISNRIKLLYKRKIWMAPCNMLKCNLLLKTRLKHFDLKVYLKMKIKNVSFFLSQSSGSPFALPWILILM